MPPSRRADRRRARARRPVRSASRSTSEGTIETAAGHADDRGQDRTPWPARDRRAAGPPTPRRAPRPASPRRRDRAGRRSQTAAPASNAAAPPEISKARLAGASRGGAACDWPRPGRRRRARALRPARPRRAGSSSSGRAARMISSRPGQAEGGDSGPQQAGAPQGQRKPAAAEQQGDADRRVRRMGVHVRRRLGEEQEQARAPSAAGGAGLYSRTEQRQREARGAERAEQQPGLQAEIGARDQQGQLDRARWRAAGSG